MKDQLLRFARFYRFVQNVLGSERYRSTLAKEVFRVEPGQRVLDIGCGPGDVLAHLPRGVDYVGIDLDAAYIDEARRRFTSRGTFVVADVAEAADRVDGEFDCVLAIGALHHLPDSVVSRVARAASRLLVPEGRWISVDPTRVPGQHPIARALVDRDRGEFVRSPEAYRALVAEHLTDTRVQVRHDLLRVPYSHAIVEARNR